MIIKTQECCKRDQPEQKPEHFQPFVLIICELMRDNLCHGDVQKRARGQTGHHPLCYQRCAILHHEPDNTPQDPTHGLDVHQGLPGRIQPVGFYKHHTQVE